MAFHDAGTYGIEGAGLGGLDGSIRYELHHADNKGISWPDDLLGVHDKHLSWADLLAAATAHAVATCGGPVLRMKGGRIDALQGGPSGLPQPHDGINQMLTNFDRMGFNKEDMIALVACGHTLGGVHHDTFPDFVDKNGDPAKPPHATNNDATPFDNKVVKEYLDGTTRNPLVVHTNKTMLSDLRIFRSDGNVTMQRLSTGSEFRSTCKNILQRMLELVPSAVTLRPAVEPIEAKVGYSWLSFTSKMTLRTDIRFLQQNENRQVTLKWNGRSGGNTVYTASPTNIARGVGTPLSAALGLNPVRYWFAPTLNSTLSVSKFWFEVDEGNGQIVTIDNGGAGYPIAQDSVLIAPAFGSQESSGNWKIVVAARDGATDVKAHVYDLHESEGDTLVPETKVLTLTPTSRSPRAGFSYYSAQVSSSRFSFDLTAQVNGQEVRQEYLSGNWYLS
ncbi:heme peroxidase [Coprinopsis sp. MPI-PUGE-AT-0042]|nr:heme peroxidase [Coprinopsis sp. MPI-PUGE-AT-0042]